MNKWSRRRKRIIFALVFAGFVIVVALPAYLLFYRPPSCFDGRKNSDETGVDCGGSCQLLCTTDSLPLIIKGDPQVLTLTDNTFEVVALVENPNATAEVYRAKYFLRLYSAQSIAPIKVIEGETFVPKGSTFAIFEGPFTTESSVTLQRATIEWQEESLVWKRNDSILPKLRVTNKELTRVDSTPRVDAVIENTSLDSVSNIDIVALVYNPEGTIFAASKTFIDSIPAGGSVPIVFVWPRAFENEVLNVEIISRILPDRSFIK